MPKTRSYGGEVDESYSNAFVFAKFVIHFARKFVEARERDGEWGEEGRWTSFVAPPPLLNWIKFGFGYVFFNSFVVAAN